MLKEIKVEGEDLVDLGTLAEIVDQYTYLPQNVKKDSNDSSNLFRVMTSGTRSSFSFENHQLTGPVEKKLDLLWIKLAEKYSGVADAYRHFDVNYNNRVTFNEFQKALDHLRIKFDMAGVQDLFTVLDKGGKGYVTYQDFTALTEERRRQLDSFDPSTAANRRQEDSTESTDLLASYLMNSDLDDLAKMSKTAQMMQVAIDSKRSAQVDMFG